MRMWRTIRLISPCAARTIVIDVGKSFQASAVEWFPKYGLRRIDAVLITHAHADGEFPLLLLWRSAWTMLTVTVLQR